GMSGGAGQARPSGGAEDVGVHGARGREALVPPHLVEEALTSEDLPPVLDEAAQRVEFLACQPDLSARSEDLPAAEVYPNVAERELLELLSGTGATEDGAHAGQELAG